MAGEPHPSRKGVDRPEALYLDTGKAVEFFRIPGTDDEEWERWKMFFRENGAVSLLLADYLVHPREVRSFAVAQRQAIVHAKDFDEWDRPTRRAVYRCQDTDVRRTLGELNNGDIVHNALLLLRDHDTLGQIGEALGKVPMKHMEAVRTITNHDLSLEDLYQLGDLHMILDAAGDDKRWYILPDEKGIQPLAYAAAADRRSVVASLLELKADPRCVDSEENSCLHYAAGYGHKELTQYLANLMIEDLNLRNRKRQTALAVAAANKHLHIASMLENMGAAV